MVISYKDDRKPVEYMDGSTCMYTVNVDIFALYIFSRNSRFLNIRENMYTSKITFIIA